MNFPRLQSYFWKILSTIGAVSIGFMLIVMSTIAYYMVVPLGQRAADDLTSIITHAAETWSMMPAEKRQLFEQKMREKHQLVLSADNSALPPSQSLLPYLYFLRRSLEHQLGTQIRIMENQGPGDEIWFWVDVPTAERNLRFGFPRSRIGVKPSVAFFVLLITGSLLTFITATYLTRRLTVTIERLYQAARQIGKGQWPEPVREEGPEELVVLARQFNRMNVEVRELLANRTTLLAGISHDLRTPLTQIQLALEMLPDEGGDPHLMKGIRRDLDAVNRLIGQALEVNLELDRDDREPVQLSELLDHLVEAAREGGQVVEWVSHRPCILVINRLALQRILGNLLENAIRYGEGKPITIGCRCDEARMVLEIQDRGPGIPDSQKEAVFQPFYRLEGSRSSRTGGSGLGLAIVRQLAVTNGWSVELVDREGGGTCARVVLGAAPVAGREQANPA
jgi:two-component system osmolarity sensor histidine kinase EnvZ